MDSNLWEIKLHSFPLFKVYYSVLDSVKGKSFPPCQWVITIKVLVAKFQVNKFHSAWLIQSLLGHMASTTLVVPLCKTSFLDILSYTCSHRWCVWLFQDLYYVPYTSRPQMITYSGVFLLAYYSAYVRRDTTDGMYSLTFLLQEGSSLLPPGKCWK